MSSVLNFLPCLLTEFFSLILFFHSRADGAVGEGSEHNNLRAKILFLALVSSINVTASSLLSRNPKWISLSQTHYWMETHSFESVLYDWIGALTDREKSVF